MSNLPKPKDAKDSTKKGKKIPKNIKIDNMTFDGTEDINWEDFVNIENGDNESDSEQNN